MSGTDLRSSQPFRSKHPWPPNFDDLTDSERYRFERKYKRRVRLRTTRPAWWMRTTGILQLATLTVLPAYLIFFHDYGENEKDNPFKPAKEWMREKINGSGSPLPQRNDTSMRRQDPK